MEGKNWTKGFSFHLLAPINRLCLVINETPYTLVMSDFVPASDGTKHSHNPQNRLHIILRGVFCSIPHTFQTKLFPWNIFN